MSISKPSNDFAERLRRIEEKRRQAGRRPIRETRKDLRFSVRKTGKAGRNTLVAAICALGIAATGYVAWTAASDKETAILPAAD